MAGQSASAQPSGSHQNDTEKYIREQEIEMAKLSPIQFLSKLVSERPKYAKVAVHPVYSVRTHWITLADVKALALKLGSKEPCCYVVSEKSSYIPQGLSTVGDEAAFLIEGYIYGYYPPELDSDAPSARFRIDWVKGWLRRHQIPFEADKNLKSDRPH